MIISVLLCVIQVSGSTSTVAPHFYLLGGELAESIYFENGARSISALLRAGNHAQAISLASQQLNRSDELPSFDDMSAIIKATKADIDVIRGHVHTLSLRLSRRGGREIDRICDLAELRSVRREVISRCVTVRALLLSVIEMRRFQSNIHKVSYLLALGDFSRYIVEQDPHREDIFLLAYEWYQQAIHESEVPSQTLFGMNSLAILIKLARGEAEAADYMVRAIRRANEIVTDQLLYGSREVARMLDDIVSLMRNNLSVWRTGEDWILVD
jgi:hypothetical protein